MKSFNQKQDEKSAKLRAERAEQARLEEQARKEKYWQANWGKDAIKHKEEQYQQALLEDAMRRAEEYENYRQERLLKKQQAEKLKQEQADSGLGIGHERTWQLSWQSFSKHPKIVNLPMSEKIRLFKIAQSKEIQPIIQPTVLGGSEEVINYVLSFSGDRAGAADSHATTTFNPDTYSLWNGFTVSFWVRPDEEMNQKSVILGTRASSPVARFHFGFSGAGANNIGVGIGGNDVTGINNPMEIGRWYNWVISYTGTQFDAGERKLRMWINTDARMTNNNSTAWNNQDEATESYTHGIYFGGRNTEGSGYTSGFACALDEVAIYNRCIDSVGTFANEVYNAGTTYNHLTNGQSGLVGYWKFNEGNGTTITDHSGNGNHGTFAPISGDTTAFPIWEELTTYG